MARVVTIRELHTHTGKVVREASEEPVFISERGRTIAVLMNADRVMSSGPRFPKRDRSLLPVVAVDSEELISEDRGR